MSVFLAAAACAPLAADPARSALFLDLDGTLAPIVAHPQDARMIPGAREVIARLRDRLGLVAFVSGRGLADLQRIVGIPGVAYAGNHGFELQIPGGHAAVADAARPWLGPIADVAAQWDTPDSAQSGVQIEPKGATLSVHWRRAANPDAASALLRERFQPDAEARGLVVTWGRMVMEVRPPVAIDKGTAVRELLADDRWRHAAYIGDDRTDADAWVALHALRDGGELTSAIAVVAASPETPRDLRAQADAAVAGPPGVLDLLLALDSAIPATA